MPTHADSQFDLWNSYMEGKQRTQQITAELASLFRFLRNITYLLLWIGTLPVEVFIHKRFGVRYLNILTVFVGSVGLSILGVLATLRGLEAAAMFNLVMTAYLLLAICHMIYARVLAKKGVLWHSRSPGEPFGFWRYLPGKQEPFDVVRFVEPMAVFGVGGAVSTFNAFGYAIMGMAVMLFAKRTLEYWQFRGALLDQLDSQIEAEVMAEMIDEARSPWEAKGFIVPKAARVRPVDAPSVEELMGDTQDQSASGRSGAVQARRIAAPGLEAAADGDSNHLLGN
jgi:hypothetical protein